MEETSTFESERPEPKKPPPPLAAAVANLAEIFQRNLRGVPFDETPTSSKVGSLALLFLLLLQIFGASVGAVRFFYICVVSLNRDLCVWNCVCVYIAPRVCVCACTTESGSFGFDYIHDRLLRSFLPLLEPREKLSSF